jgi:hypothetical protein
MNTVRAIKLPIVIQICIITTGGCIAKEYISIYYVCIYSFLQKNIV